MRSHHPDAHSALGAASNILSRCFTVGQAARFAHKRLSTILRKPAVDDAAIYTLAIPGAEGAPPTALSSTTTLRESRIEDEVRITCLPSCSLRSIVQDCFELIKEPPYLVVRVFVPHGRDKNTTVSLRFPGCTPTHQVIEKLCERFHALQIPV